MCSVSDGKTKKQVEYLRCVNCQWRFFATKRNKDIYLDITGNNRKDFKGAWVKLFKEGWDK
jgi:hypothetical protein